MAWSGGTFSRALGPSQWANDAAANVGIQAGIHDTQDNDLATAGINECLNKGGQNAPTANLSMGGFAHTNVGDATLLTQYPSVKQVQNGFGSWCGTSGGSANAQTLTPSPAILAGIGGQRFTFVAGFTNTAAATINVSGLGATAVIRPDGHVLYAGDITAGNTYTIINNNASSFVLVNPTPQWNSWTAAVGTVTGSLSAPTTSANFIVSLSGLVTFAISYSGTLAGGPTSTISLTAPVTAANTDAAWGGKANVVLAPVPAIGYFNTTSQIYIVNANASTWANGTLTANLAGSYQAA